MHANFLFRRIPEVVPHFSRPLWKLFPPRGGTPHIFYVKNMMHLLWLHVQNLIEVSHPRTVTPLSVSILPASSWTYQPPQHQGSPPRHQRCVPGWSCPHHARPTLWPCISCCLSHCQRRWQSQKSLRSSPGVVPLPQLGCREHLVALMPAAPVHPPAYSCGAGAVDAWQEACSRVACLSVSACHLGSESWGLLEGVERRQRAQGLLI